MFNSYVTEVIKLFESSLANQDWSNVVNCCGSITGFLMAFPERMPEFKQIVVPLIQIVKEKTEVVRKNGAILLARLAKDPELEKVIRANHGFDVLVSLRQAL